MGTELFIGLALAFVVLGPERMHSMLGQFGRAKAQLEKASQQTREQLVQQLEERSDSFDKSVQAGLPGRTNGETPPVG
jgi:Sec-independent protein translocase protein TatA